MSASDMRACHHRSVSRPRPFDRTTSHFYSTANTYDGNGMCHGEDNASLPFLILPMDRQGQGEQQHHRPIRTVAAPMVASSDYAFRCLCRQYGTDLVFTQMLHARNLINDSTFVTNHWDIYESCNGVNQIPLLPSQRTFLEGLGHDENGTPSIKGSTTSRGRIQKHAQVGPVIVQLAGNDVSTMQAAAEFVMERQQQQQEQLKKNGIKSSAMIAGIDLNCGCPQGIARKGNYGAFLLHDQDGLDKVCAILTNLRRTLPPHVSVSTKIRLPVEIERLEQSILPRLMDTGMNFLTIHGRNLYENKTSVGACHLDRIQQAINFVNRRHALQEGSGRNHGLPIIANGGVEVPADVVRIQQQTGAAAVMSSEALLERPNLFSSLQHLLQNQKHQARNALVDELEHMERNKTPRQRLEEQFQMTYDYLEWCRLYPPLPGAISARLGTSSTVRGHVFKFLYRYLGSEQTDIRDRLGSSDPQVMPPTYLGLRRVVDDLYDRYRLISDEELNALPSSDSTLSSWYRRHRTPSATDNNYVHRRRQQISATKHQSPSATLSVEERKRLLKQRIGKLQDERVKKETKTTNIASFI